MKCQAVDGCLRCDCSVADERGPDGQLEGADGSGRAGDEIGKISGGDGLPGADAVYDKADEVSGGDEDHALAGPDNGGLKKKQERADDADLADAIQRKEEPVFDLGEPGVLWEFGEEFTDGLFEHPCAEDEDEESDSGDGQRQVRDEAVVRGYAGAHEGDEEKDQREDVEQLFKDDGAEDGRRRGSEIARVGEDAHDVADAQGQDVVGGQRGHQDAGADTETSPGGAHHVSPSDAAQGVAGEGEDEDTDDPDRVHEPQSADLGEGDAFEGVPEEKSADYQSRNGLEEIAAAGRGHAATASGVEAEQDAA